MKISYRANRAAEFNSDRFHETDEASFKQDYLSQRINITPLYGYHSQWYCVSRLRQGALVCFPETVRRQERGKLVRRHWWPKEIPLGIVAPLIQQDSSLSFPLDPSASTKRLRLWAMAMIARTIMGVRVCIRISWMNN